MYWTRMCSTGSRGFFCNQMIVGFLLWYLCYYVRDVLSMCTDFETPNRSNHPSPTCHWCWSWV